MKRKQLSLVLAAAFSGLCLSQYASADTATGTNPAAKTANPYAAHYGYPETRTSQDEIDRFETGEYGDPGLRSDSRNNTVGHDIRKLKRKDDGIDRYYGDVLVDKYRWLEDVERIEPEYRYETSEDRKRNYFGTLWENPEREKLRNAMETVHNEQGEVDKWVNAQNEATHNYLNKIPYIQEIGKRIDKLMDYEYLYFDFDREYGKFHYARYPDGYFRLSKKGADGKSQVILDEKELSKDGYTQIVNYALNSNGKYFAYATRDGASDTDHKELYVLDTETLKTRHITTNIHVVDAGGTYGYPLEWKDNNNLYYVRSHGGWTDLMLHRMDKNEFNDPIIMKASDYDMTPDSFWIEDDRYLMVQGSLGSISNTLLLKDLKTGRWIQIHNRKMYDKINKADAFTNYTAAKFVRLDGNYIYVISEDNSEFGELLKIDIRSPQRKREVVIPARENHRLTAGVYQSGHYLMQYYSAGYDSLALFDENGKFVRDITPVAGGSISSLTAYDSGDKDAENNRPKGTLAANEKDYKRYVWFYYQNKVTPTTTYRYNVEEDKFFGVKRRDTIPFDADKYEMRTVSYPSKDGTMVPIVISHKKGLKLDGKNPTILYGYGGFNVDAYQGNFTTSAAAWMQNGGVYATAGLRGGKEYGSKWHDAGKQLNKQNVFDDFIAAGEFLIKEGYTSKDYLSISGGSNGGLLVGATMVQRPDLFRVAIPEVGVLDMLRHDKMYRTDYWINEYGMAEDSKAMYQKLLSYSPYHNVRDGVCYPSTMVMTSKRDDRVVPSHSYKFAAILQEKQSCMRPVFLNAAERHGHGDNTRAETKREMKEKFAFILHEMGIKSLPPIPDSPQPAADKKAKK